MRNCSLSITTAEQFSTIQSKIQEWAGWQTWMHYKGSVSLEDIIDLMQAQKHLPLSSKEKLELLLSHIPHPFSRLSTFFEIEIPG